MDIDIVKVRHILSVAKHRSFSRAAEELNLTQPALSRSIASIEQRFGLRLFDRSPKGVEPTTVGKLVIAEAEGVMRAARGLSHNMRIYANGAGGELAIGISPLLVPLFSEIGRQLLDQAPRMRLYIRTGNTRSLLKHLLNDEIELIIGSRTAILDETDLAVSTIAGIDNGFVVRRDHPLAERGRVSLADLEEFPIAQPVVPNRKGLPTGTGSIVCDNFHLLRDITLSTDCIWMCPSILVTDDLASGSLHMLDVGDCASIEFELCFASRRGIILSPLARSLVERATETLLSANR